MVYVRLAQAWTDDEGVDHPAGAMVDVDAVTLGRLEAQGMVAETAPRPAPPPRPGGDESDGAPGPGGGGPDFDDDP